MMKMARLFAVPFVVTALLSAPTISAQESLSQEMRDLRGKMSELAEQGAFGELAEFAADSFTIEPKPNTSFEEIKACGFYPQETRLECVIAIKQRTGYGGPVGSFGSFEHVKFCIDWNDNGNFEALTESVGSGIVHMHDEVSGGQPPWAYAVYRDFDPAPGLRTNFGGLTTTTVTSAPTRKARAILSWVTAPTDCDYTPVWGNVFNFRIRFDPIR